MLMMPLLLQLMFYPTQAQHFNRILYMTNKAQMTSAISLPRVWYGMVRPTRHISGHFGDLG